MRLLAGDVFPDLGALTGTDSLERVAGALLSFTLIVAVLMLIVCAIIWAIASASGNISASVKARTGLLVALGSAALAGAGTAWLNWLIDIGSSF